MRCEDIQDVAEYLFSHPRHEAASNYKDVYHLSFIVFHCFLFFSPASVLFGIFRSSLASTSLLQSFIKRVEAGESSVIGWLAFRRLIRIPGGLAV